MMIYQHSSHSMSRHSIFHYVASLKVTLIRILALLRPNWEPNSIPWPQTSWMNHWIMTWKDNQFSLLEATTPQQRTKLTAFTIFCWIISATSISMTWGIFVATWEGLICTNIARKSSTETPYWNKPMEVGRIWKYKTDMSPSSKSRISSLKK